jgi:hypothetical protein
MSFEAQQAGKIILGSLTMALAAWLILRQSFAARPRVEYLRIRPLTRSRRTDRTKR